MEPSTTQLSYSQPAEQWSAALPIGNGRLGAMMYGRVTTELIQLNEDTVWFGGPQSRMAQGAYEKLSKLRRLIREHRHPEAERLVEHNFYSRPAAMRHYEPLATLKLQFQGGLSPFSNYRRSLCLQDGISRVEYEQEGIQWYRETFASYPDDAIVMRLVASRRSSFNVNLTRLGENEGDTNEFYDRMTIGEAQMAIYFGPVGASGLQSRCTVRAICSDGLIQRTGNGLSIDSKETVLIIQAQTNFRSNVPELQLPTSLESPLAFGTWYEGLLSKHMNDYHSLFKSAQLQLCDANDSKVEPEWTDGQLSTFPTCNLFSTYFNFGRYLMISCSRTHKAAPELSLPANLQGIWNPSFSPAWGSKFTININLQMNYWPCHAWNLSMLSDPLFFLLQRMSERGKKTAQEMYGVSRAGSWCAHHNTDLWADCDPADEWMPSTLWPLGGAWLSLHIYERYQYEGPDDQLHGEPFLPRMFPVLQGAAAFVLGLLVEDDEKKHLIPSPSLSPENTYAFLSSSQQLVEGVLCEGSTMDVSIVSTVFEHFVASIDQLRYYFSAALTLVDFELLNDVQQAYKRLPPPRIGTDGRLLEWQKEYHEPEPGHRHFSHLFAVYPGASITPAATPQLANACREVLNVRLANGGAHTGWSRAWLICLYARLHDGEECLKHLELLLQKSTQPNMFDSHPPMQIDGNFGGCAGILEMLIQSHEVEIGKEYQQKPPVRIIRLLPACPARWLAGAGKVCNVRARGGFTLSFCWSEGSLKDDILIHSQGRESGRICLPDGRQVNLLPEKGSWKIPVRVEGAPLHGAKQ